MALVVRNPPANAGDSRDVDLIPGSGRSPGGGRGNPLQYFCLRILWTEEPGGLRSMGLHRVGHKAVTEHAHTGMTLLRHRVALCLTLQELRLFHRGGTILRSRQDRVRSPISLHPHQRLRVSVFCIIAVTVNVKWCLAVVLIGIPLMTNGVQHLFMYLLTMCQ